MHILLLIFAFIAFCVYCSIKNKLHKEEPIPPPRLANWQVATSQTVNWQDLLAKQTSEGSREVSRLRSYHQENP